MTQTHHFNYLKMGNSGFLCVHDENIQGHTSQWAHPVLHPQLNAEASLSVHLSTPQPQSAISLPYISMGFLLWKFNMNRIICLGMTSWAHSLWGKSVFSLFGWESFYESYTYLFIISYTIWIHLLCGLNDNLCQTPSGTKCWDTYIYSIWVFACANICVPHACSSCRKQHQLELESQTAVSLPVGPESQTWVLCKNSQC